VTLGLNAQGAWRFFRPATAGAFGAVAALGRLARLDPAILADAFGIMLGQVSGTMQPHAEGRGLLPLQMGFNARNALMALDLAQARVEGTQKTFEGERGYFALFEGGWDASAALAELGHRFRIAELSHKPYPSGRATHGLIDGLLRLRAEHAFSADEVERVVLLGSPLIAQLVARPLNADMSVSYARLCARYVGAVALRQGTVRLDDFSPQSLADPDIRALADRIDIGIDEAIAGRVLLPQSLLVRLKGGTLCHCTVTEVLGSPARPLSRDQALAKFWACWEESAGTLPRENGMRTIELVDRLEKLDSVLPLIRLCAA
jgi:2-methylcitrate dehydratase PrpD